MPTTNFPMGVTSFGFPLIGSGGIVGLGAVFFVNSATGSDANGYGTDPSRPFATIAYALTKCTANADQTIIVAQGHAEAIIGAAGWTTVSGVQVIGMNRGAKRPTITFGTSTAAQIVCAGNNTLFKNLVFDLTGIDAVVAGFSITGTDVIFEDCRVVIAGATNQAAIGVSLDTGVARPVFRRTHFFGTSDAGPAHAVKATVACDGLVVEDCDITGNFSAAPIGTSSTFHLTNMRIKRNHFAQYNGTAKVVLALTTSSTGFVTDNRALGTTWATAADFESGGSSTSMLYAENYGYDNSTASLSAVLVPAVGTIA